MCIGLTAKAHADENGKCSTVAAAKKVSKPTTQKRQKGPITAGENTLYLRANDPASIDQSGKATHRPEMLPTKAATVLPEMGNDVGAASATNKAALEAVHTERLVLANFIEE
jgi:hypothetical protein